MAEDNMTVGAVKGRQIYQVDAVQLYKNTNEHISVNANNDSNPFKGTVSWGLFGYNIGDFTGQADGGTKPEYHEDGTVYEPKTLCWA